MNDATVTREDNMVVIRIPVVKDSEAIPTKNGKLATIGVSNHSGWLNVGNVVIPGPIRVMIRTAVTPAARAVADEAPRATPKVRQRPPVSSSSSLFTVLRDSYAATDDGNEAESAAILERGGYNSATDEEREAAFQEYKAYEELTAQQENRYPK